MDQSSATPYVLLLDALNSYGKGNKQQGDSLLKMVPDSLRNHYRPVLMHTMEKLRNEPGNTVKMIPAMPSQVKNTGASITSLSWQDSIIVHLQQQLQWAHLRQDSLQNQVAQLQAAAKQPITPKAADFTLNYYFFKGQRGVPIKYVGEWKNGMANGEGIGFFETGSVYKGQWQNNLRHGSGIFTWPDGEQYEGNYLLDKRHGFGKYIWKTGLWYEGEWANDERHGEGTLYAKNGQPRYSGIWKND
ncbi:MAG TPA: hypothetical protein PKD90_10740, partial [Phnomibacter sp.]|nr:hypothetical protein [Phnomibacter sp.]